MLDTHNYGTGYRELAGDYSRAVHISQVASIDADPEAQLTTPFTMLLQELAELSSMPRLSLVRETRLEGSRPDFSAIFGRSFCGWIELKSPSTVLEPEHWSGHNASQWEKFSSLENLILSNGRQAILYNQGSVIHPEVTLPYDGPEGWDPEPLISCLKKFYQSRSHPITSVSSLAKRLAHRTIDLRESIISSLSESGSAGTAARRALESWKLLVHPLANEKDFCDSVAQVIAYGMVLAVLTQDPARNEDGIVTVLSARQAIRASSPVMAAAFGVLLDNRELRDSFDVRLRALENLVSSIDVERINQSIDSRGEPWLFFYEDFLAEYDAEEKRQAGVYFTPIPVVKCMVKMVERLLRNRFGIRLGFADRSVVTLDPAVGTGTFPLEVIDRASQRAQDERGDAGPSQVSTNLINNLYAFEMLPGPYSVAHLRLGQRLKKMGADISHNPKVMLTDTLEAPDDSQSLPTLFGDPEVLAQEQVRANRFKTDQPVTVVIGNPPYRRVSSDLQGRGTGDWILNGNPPGREPGQSLFDDILDVARENTIFSHHASLYNLYIYFWRWSIWKAFEAHSANPGIVALITGSSWLRGPGFVGLRKLIRQTCDEVWVIDLGGDNHGAVPEENIFAIETPVAICICVRNSASDPATLAPVHYRRYRGTKEQKLTLLSSLAELDNPFEGEWPDAPNDVMAPFIPVSGSQEWLEMPALTDLFPWQQPGCKFGRTWPIAPDRDSLLRRWEVFAGATVEDKPDLFYTPRTGRNITTNVLGLQPLNSVNGTTNCPKMVRYAYRSFDVQWTFEDPRFIALERPSLWQSRSDAQIFLTTLMTGVIGSGQALTATCYVPDLHFFRGSCGGKDVIPLYKDSTCLCPNITSRLLEQLGEALSIPKPSPEDLMCYVYSILSSPSYQLRFKQALETPGPRVPITKDAMLWDRAVGKGRYLLWLHTYGHRFSSGSSFPPTVPDLGWKTAITEMPEANSAISYNSSSNVLQIGDGEVSGVRPDVWQYSVSGMQVVMKWLGYRTKNGSGRATSSTSPLDRIRPDHWIDEWNDELLDLLKVLTKTTEQFEDQANLLQEVLDGPLISAESLPIPTDRERRVPPTRRDRPWYPV